MPSRAFTDVFQWTINVSRTWDAFFRIGPLGGVPGDDPGTPS